MNTKTPILIAVDLDGTLLNDKKEITEYTKKVFYTLGCQNYIIVIITARSYKRTITYLNQIHGHFAVCNNGASIWNKYGECIYTRYIGAQSYKELIKKIYHNFPNIKLKIVMPTQTICVYSYQAAKNFADKPIEGLLLQEHIEKALLILQDGFYQKRVLENAILMISNHSATKLQGLKQLLKKIHISRENTIGFGDDLNDIDFLKYCCKAIVPLNGNPKIVKIATDICDDNNLNGVAKWLSKAFDVFNGGDLQ